MDSGTIVHEPSEAEFTWKIDYFFSVFHQDENIKWYESPCYHFVDISFHFRLYHRSHAFPGFMKLCLNYSFWPFYGKHPVIEYKYGFETQNNNLVKVVRGIMTEEAQECGRCVFRLSELLERKSELAPSGVVTIKCKMKYSPISNNPSSPRLSIPEEPKQKKLKKLDTLSENFRSLFVKKEGYDVILQVMGKQFKAHSTVLMARSPVFAAMFRHECSPIQPGMVTRRQKKKSEKMVIIPGGTVTVSDCDSGSFQLFLKYLYSGEMEEVSTETAIHLYEMSIKYKVWDLERLCVDILVENLTVENVFDVGIIADKYHDTVLFSKTTDFFCRNVDKILNTPVWDSFVKSNRLLSKKYYGGPLSEKKRARLAACVPV